MPTVLHVTQPCDAGVASYVAALCADQQARGWDVAVACPDRGWLSGDLATRGVRRIGWEAERAVGADVPSETRRLRRLLDRAGPDVLHLHSAKAGLAGRLAARGRMPTIFQPHGWSWLAAPAPMVGASLAWERIAARWTTLFVCVGEGEAAQGRVHGLRGRYCVVRNGVDLTRFTPADDAQRREARTALDLPLHAPLAVCVGRAARQKGQDVLLAAWTAVRARCPEAMLVLVGGGELLESLYRQAPPGVAFAGHVDDPRPWYAAADLVVLPSRWEGLPLTLLEAMAMGRSVIGSDIPGISEALPEGTGALVPPDEPIALADAITYRMRHVDVTRAEGAAAARYAARNADARRAYDALATITARLAGSRRRGRTAAGTRGRIRRSPDSATPRAGSSR